MKLVYSFVNKKLFAITNIQNVPRQFPFKAVAFITAIGHEKNTYFRKKILIRKYEIK